MTGGADHADIGAGAHHFPGPAATGMLFAKLNNITNLNVYEFHILLKFKPESEGGE